MEPARRCSGVLRRESKPGSQEAGAGAWEMSGGPQEEREEQKALEKMRKVLKGKGEG